jgi:hypothetical protein
MKLTNTDKLMILLVGLTALYPIAELTRVIKTSGREYFPEKWENGQLKFEIGFMWVFYIGGLVAMGIYLDSKNK